MTTVMSRNFDSPDELRTPSNAQVAVVVLGSAKVARFRLEPGWRWSESVKPVVGTDTCQARHVGVLVSGTMTVRATDGTESAIAPGAAYVIEPGHDAWVTGAEPVVAYEFERETADTYAKPAS
jgi:hypothetical protein